MAEKRFSELTTAGAMTGAELLAMSQETLGTLLSVKSTLQNIANWFAVNSQYASALDTSNKTLCGAINELRQLISLIPQFSIEVVQTLPTEDISETTIYLVPSSDPEQGNYYEEYIYVNNTWELVGTTVVDLSAYYTKLEVDGLLSAKANTADVTAALALKEAKADMDDDVTDIIVALTDTQTATGNPVTLTTAQEGGAKSALVTFEPKQDLHGQSAPYPAGGGKNKLPLKLSTIKSLNSGGTWSENAYTMNNVVFTVLTNSIGEITGIQTSGTSNAQAKIFLYNGKIPSGSYILNGCPSGGATQTYWQTVYNSIDDTGSGASFTSDGNTTYTSQIICRANINMDNLVFKPMIRLATESDSSFAPYSNICPISGRDSVSLNQCGVNQWDEVTEIGGININTGANTGATTVIRSKNYNECKANANYYVLGATNIFWYKKDKTYIGYGLNGIQTAPQEAYYFRLGFSTGYGTTYNNDSGVNYPSTETDYEPFKGLQTHTATFPDTVYGGSYDFVSGEGSET